MSKSASILPRSASSYRLALSPTKYCYQCDRPVFWLAPDGRCCLCPHCSVDDVTGGGL